MTILGLILAAAGQMAQSAYTTHIDETREARRLAQYINEVRASEGLPPVSISPQLSRVARAHARDLMENRPDSGGDRYGRRCTLHSWSAAGSWSPVCYTADNAHAAAMWNKPREITRGAYRGQGFEIAYRRDDGATAESAMDGWLRSSAHEAVVLELGAWRSTRWQAMGVAIQGNYAIAWFGKERDTQREARAR